MTEIEFGADPQSLHSQCSRKLVKLLSKVWCQNERVLAWGLGEDSRPLGIGGSLRKEVLFCERSHIRWKLRVMKGCGLVTLMWKIKLEF